MSNEVEQRVLTMTDKRNLEKELEELRQAKLDVAEAVSYTHLDVYKRQSLKCNFSAFCAILALRIPGLALRNLRILRENWRKIPSKLRIFPVQTHAGACRKTS